MRVIMFPAVGVKNENRYIDILVQGLRDIGVEVESWHKHLSFQKGDVFHVHWPEIVAGIRERKWNSLRGEWIAFQFFSTIKRIKKSGGRLVWTAHDLSPHSHSLRGTAFLEKFMARFIAETDVVLSLTSAGIEQIKQSIPALKDAAFKVAHHPHYRDILGEGNYSAEARAAFGIKPEQRVFSFIGTLRPNKRPDLVVQAFKNLPRASNFLIMAGAIPKDLTEDMPALTADIPNALFDFRRIPEEEIGRLYAATDIFVFPGTDYFNSGTIYTALSLNVPVIAAWSPTNEEIRELVGANWLHLYREPFSTSVLEDAAQALIKRDEHAFCDLSRLSPKACAEEHLEAYKTNQKAKTPRSENAVL